MDIHPHVLIADDDDDLRHLIASELRRWGCKVEELHDGGRLLVRIGQEYSHAHRPEDSFDVIITDVYMPVCTGTQLLEGLRRAHWTIPIVVMTAFPTTALRERVAKFGGFLYEKPFDIDKLKDDIVELTSKKRGTVR